MHTDGLVTLNPDVIWVVGPGISPAAVPTFRYRSLFSTTSNILQPYWTSSTARSFVFHRTTPETYNKIIDVLKWKNHGRPRTWARGRHWPITGKVEKCYHMKKNSISEVSLNGQDAAFSWRDTVNDCSTPIISFISVYYKRIRCCCTRILKRMNGRRTRPPDMGLGSQCKL